MISFEEALMNLAVAAESQYMRSRMTLVLEPDLYERFTFTLKQTLPSELHQKFDSGEFTISTPVGRMVITRWADKITPTPLTDEELADVIANDEDLQNETK